MNFENSESLSLDANGKFSLEKFNEIRNKIITGLIGCKIPDFNVKTINNKVLNTQDFRGKVIVLNFWFTACSPCIAEMPALNMLEKEYHDSDVVFIAFSTDDSIIINKFLQNKEFKYEIVTSTYDMSDKFCIRGYPTNMVFDKKGILKQIFYGIKKPEEAITETYNKLKPTIDKYLNEPK